MNYFAIPGLCKSSPEELLEEVCAASGLPPEVVTGKSRKAPVVRARHSYINRLWGEAGMSKRAIATLLNIHRKTVINAINLQNSDLRPAHILKAL